MLLTQCKASSGQADVSVCKSLSCTLFTKCTATSGQAGVSVSHCRRKQKYPIFKQSIVLVHDNSVDHVLPSVCLVAEKLGIKPCMEAEPLALMEPGNELLAVHFSCVDSELENKAVKYTMKQ